MGDGEMKARARRCLSGYPGGAARGTLDRAGCTPLRFGWGFRASRPGAASFAALAGRRDVTALARAIGQLVAQPDRAEGDAARAKQQSARLGRTATRGVAAGAMATGWRAGVAVSRREPFARSGGATLVREVAALDTVRSAAAVDNPVMRPPLKGISGYHCHSSVDCFVGAEAISRLFATLRIMYAKR